MPNNISAKSTRANSSKRCKLRKQFETNECIEKNSTII